MAVPGAAPLQKVDPVELAAVTRARPSLPLLPFTGAQGTLPAAGSTPPQVIHQVQPEYPAEAQATKATGSVVLAVEVLKDGSVGSVRWVEGNALFKEAAVAAVKQWRYRPAARNGEPVQSVVVVELAFSPK